MTTNPFDADRPPERQRRGEGQGRRDQKGGRRRDESLMVPEVSFDSYYGRHIVKPAPWEKEVAAYLFLGGLAGSSALLAAGGRTLGYPALRRVGRMGALGAAALGGAALAKDLGKPSRALNMMRTLKLTSPMSVGSWILTAFSGFSAVALASEATQALAGRRGIPARSSGSAVARVARAFELVEGPATVGAALFGPPLAAYTAVLLADTATPTWHESYRELPFVFVSSANLAASGLALVAVPTAQTGPADPSQQDPDDRRRSRLGRGGAQPDRRGRERACPDGGVGLSALRRLRGGHGLGHRPEVHRRATARATGEAPGRRRRGRLDHDGAMTRRRSHGRGGAFSTGRGCRE